MEDKAPRMTLLRQFDIDRLLFGEDDFWIAKSSDDLDEENDAEDLHKEKDVQVGSFS